VSVRPHDHVAQCELGGDHLALGRQHQCRGPQVFGLVCRVGHATADLPNLVQLRSRELQLPAHHASLGASSEGQRPQRVVAGRLRFRHRPVGFHQSAIERALLPIGDPQVVVALSDALAPPRPFEGGARDLPGRDRLRMPPPQVTDDPQIVGAAAGHRDIGVPAGDHERPGAIIRGFVDPPADQGDGTPRIEGATFYRPLVAPTRLVQRYIEPQASLVVAPQPRVRGPVQQGEARRSLELAPLAGAEVRDDVGVAAGRGQLLGFLDYER
jgi:hypothetical protein